MLVVKNPPANAGDIRDAGLFPGLGRVPEGGHGNTFQYSCWRIPWTEETGRLQPIGSQRVGYDWNDLARVCAHTHTYTYHIIFIHSSVDGHLCWFHVLAIVNSAAINNGVHVSFGIRVFRYMPRSGIGRSYGSVRNLHTVLYSGLQQFTFPPTL